MDTASPTARPTARLSTLWRRYAIGALALSVIAAATIAGCGGGVGTGGTGGYAAGPITGFGSVIVNNIRFDDTTATVVDGDGKTRSRDDLRLGMTVEVEGQVTTAGSDTTTGAGSASRIRVDSDLLGTVSSVDAANSRLTLLGQTVVVDAATAYDSSTPALSSLKAGQAVEVFAVFDAAANVYRATRIAPAASGSTPHLRGLVVQVDSTQRTLRIGDVAYAFGSASGVPADIAAGQVVRLSLTSSSAGASSFPVQAFGTTLSSPPDGDECSVTGTVTGYVTQRSFSINGRAIDASGATVSGGSIGLGVKVKVEGRYAAGVIKATKVEVSSSGPSTSSPVIELSGSITAVNSADRSFVLRGLTVTTTRSDLVYDGGTAASLVVGRAVEVKGRLAGDGQRIEATKIKFE